MLVNKKKYLLVALSLLISFIIIGNYLSNYKQSYRIDSKDNFFPLLLNSELVQCRKAIGQYIIWTEDEQQLSDIEKIIQTSGLVWEKYVLADFAERKAYKYTANFSIEKENEGQFVELFKHLNSSLNQQKVKVYFEERINTFLEPASYFEYYDIGVYRSIQTDNIKSFAGFRQDLSHIIKAGDERINVQIVAKKNDGLTGKTVLAFPALLEEF